MPNLPSGVSSVTLLEVRGLTHRFGGLTAVEDVSISLAEGCLTALIGPNGAGKTSLFNLITGALRIQTGEVWFAGENISGRRPDAIARLGLQRTHQNPRPFRALSVLDNVMLGAQQQVGERLGRVFMSPRRVRGREREIEANARELLTLVRLDDKADDLAGTLSGGQRKLLELARVLMGEPRMVLLDEPVAGVNPALREELRDAILLNHEQQRTTFVLIEHDLDLVGELGERLIVMAAGTIIADGDPSSTWSDPAVVDAYIGAAR